MLGREGRVGDSRWWVGKVGDSRCWVGRVGLEIVGGG